MENGLLSIIHRPENRREWMGDEPTAARNATRHWCWRPGSPPGPNHSHAQG